MEFTTTVDAPLDEVFAWHERPGAIGRLIPPWQPLRVLSEAQSLASGKAVLGMPFGLTWTAQHLTKEYRDHERFVDELTTPILRNIAPWRHAHSFAAQTQSRTRITDTIDTRIPDSVLNRNMAYRERQIHGDFASHALARSLGAEPMTIAVTGSSGLIGTALCAFLSTGGHRVVQLVRRAPSESPHYAQERYWNPDDPATDLLDGIDAVIHLAGESVAGRFNSQRREKLLSSRVRPTRRLAELMGTRPFVVASGVGIYGPDRGDEILTESSERGDGFLAELAVEWEAAADPARESGSRVTHVRTGIVQSPNGGVLELMRPLFFVGAGGRLGNGRQWTPWIGIDDMVDIYLRCVVDRALVGPVNAVAPNPVTNRDYTRVLAKVMRRPGIMSVPALGPKLIFGSEAVREFILAGQRVQPALLESLDHPFRFTELEAALRHLLGR
ncbi:MAG: TIGR01777 family oxidoreductase [Microthrixaceae bacterium]